MSAARSRAETLVMGAASGVDPAARLPLEVCADEEAEVDVGHLGHEALMRLRRDQ